HAAAAAVGPPALMPAGGHVALVEREQPGTGQRDELLARRQRLGQRMGVQLGGAGPGSMLVDAVGQARQERVEHVLDRVVADAQDDAAHRAAQRGAGGAPDSACPTTWTSSPAPKAVKLSVCTAVPSPWEVTCTVAGKSRPM